MNDEPRQRLRELIVEYGRSLCDDPNRCEALLKDYCGIYKREIFVLVAALKKRVTYDMMKSSAGVPQELVIGRICKRLEYELGLTSEASRWAAESWALALGFTTAPSPLVKLTSHPKELPVVPTVPPVVLSHQKAEVLIAGRYLNNGDGTVTDVRTGLQWMRFSLGQNWVGGTCLGEPATYSWQDALNAAEILNRYGGGYAGHRDWGLPFEGGLLSLVYCSSGRPDTCNDTGKICEGDYLRPTIDKRAFPNTPSSYFWSASTDSYTRFLARYVSDPAGLARTPCRRNLRHC